MDFLRFPVFVLLPSFYLELLFPSTPYYEVNCALPPAKSCIKALIPKMTAFGNRASEEVIMVKLGHESRILL